MGKLLDYPGKERPNETAVVWDLYQNGEITFDEDMSVNYSGEALKTLEEILRVTQLLLCPFEESIPFLRIRAEEIDSRSNPRITADEAISNIHGPH